MTLEPPIKLTQALCWVWVRMTTSLLQGATSPGSLGINNTKSMEKHQVIVIRAVTTEHRGQWS